MEPWSIVAEHPQDGEPFGVVMQDDSTFTEAEYIARQLLATFLLTGGYFPTHPEIPLNGHYLFTYTVAPETIPRLATIWAYSFEDAEMRLNLLAADGTLFMPSPG
jgi:hypothetical protein